MAGFPALVVLFHLRYKLLWEIIEWDWEIECVVHCALSSYGGIVEGMEIQECGD